MLCCGGAGYRGELWAACASITYSLAGLTMALGGARGRRDVGRGEGGRGIQPYVVLRVPRCLLWPAERGRRRRVELCAPARGARGRGASTTFAMHPGPGEIATGARRRSARRGLVGAVCRRRRVAECFSGRPRSGQCDTNHIRYDNKIFIKGQRERKRKVQIEHTSRLVVAPCARRPCAPLPRPTTLPRRWREPVEDGLPACVVAYQRNRASPHAAPWSMPYHENLE